MTRAQKLYSARKTFEGSKYEPMLEKLTRAYRTKDLDLFDSVYTKLPTHLEMLDNILEKVRGKKVFKTLKKTVTEDLNDKTESLVGLSSLMTHVIIECKTNREYRALLPDLYVKLGVLIGQV